jgi:hypothetical protein
MDHRVVQGRGGRSDFPMLPVQAGIVQMHKSSFIQMVLGYIPGSEGYIPLFLQGTIVLGTVVSSTLRYKYGEIVGRIYTHEKCDTLLYSPSFVPFFFVPSFFDHWGKWSYTITSLGKFSMHSPVLGDITISHRSLNCFVYF